MKKAFFYLSLGAIVLFMFIYTFYDYNYIENNVISEERYKEIISNKKEVTGVINLYYNNIKIPYNEKSNFYISNFEDYNNIYSNLGYKINVISYEDGKVNIVLYNNRSYKTSTIYISNLPVISISTDRTKKENMYGSLTLYTDTYDIMYHIRGATSRIPSNTKKSYKIEMLDSDANSMLDLKESKEYILNPLYLDSSYIREYIDYDIWNALNGDYTVHMKPIELFLDGKYKGIYALQETVSLNTFNASDNDLLVSTKKWRNEIENPNIYDELYMFSDEIDEFEIDDGLKNKNLRRQLLLAFLDNIDGTNYSGLKVTYDTKSNGNYNVFLNLVMPLDNLYKNEKILFRDEDNQYVIYKMPWDLDWSLSNDQISAKTDISAIIYDRSLPNSLLADDHFIKYQKEKYFEIRKTVYNEEYLNNLIDTYASLLRNSGAIERSESEDSFENSITIIKSFFKERIKVLDEYYGGL